MKRIFLNHITKIEGHAELDVQIKDSEVKKVNLRVFEGPRFFEAILKGRRWDEVPLLTSRICGVCSVSHHLTAIMAVENAFGVKATKQTKLLRELLYNGNIIQSHVLHLFFLALPDYLGFADAITMAASPKHRAKLAVALKLKQLGNEFVSIIGGRDLHAITPVVGGFSKIPEQKNLDLLLKKLKDAKKDVVSTAELFVKMKYPKLVRDAQLFSLKVNPKLKNPIYPIVEGNIGCIGGVCIKAGDYTKHFHEFIKKGSTAKTVLVDDEPFMVGALPRIAQNAKLLSKDSKKLLNKSFPKGIIPANNPYYNNTAQAIELVHVFDRCIEILKSLKVKHEQPVEIKPKSSRGIAVTEAPRGLLFHDYSFDSKGYVKEANIIPPTTQNLKRVEDDIRLLLPIIMNKKNDEIVLDIEKLIRAYDPCISCSAHFLKVNWDIL